MKCLWVVLITTRKLSASYNLTFQISPIVVSEVTANVDSESAKGMS